MKFFLHAHVFPVMVQVIFQLLMRFGNVLISLKEMVGRGALSGVRSPTEYLFVIKLFDTPCDLKKSVIRTCLVDVLSICGKECVWALCLSITSFKVDLGLWEL